MILATLGIAIPLLNRQSMQTVVCLGDSITLKYAPALEQDLGRKFIVKVEAAAGALPSEAQISASIRALPDIVLVSLGTDAAADSEWTSKRDRFVPHVENMIERIRGAASHPKVFLCLPPPSNLQVSDVRASLLTNQIVPLLKQAAREAKCSTIDFDAALNDRRDLIDGLLPDDAGSQVLADTVTEAIFSGRKADWKVIYSDSEELDEGPAKNAIDGDPDTYWHTNYSTTQEKYPHEIQVDTGLVRTIGGFSYYPRQDGVNGRVAKYEFYVSLDGKNWGDAVAMGSFKQGGELSKVYFSKPVLCRYFRFRALSEQQGQMWASAAELDILKFYPKRP